MVFNTGPYTVLPDNSILNTAKMQSETGFPSSHQLKSYVASKSRLKLAVRAVLSADAGLLVIYVLRNVYQRISDLDLLPIPEKSFHTFIVARNNLSQIQCNKISPKGTFIKV